MRVFVAGGSGVIGQPLVRELVRRGHAVTATTRTLDNRQRLAELGARPVLLDALDEGAVLAAVRDAAPEVVVHELTAISGTPNLRRLDRDFAQTNRLRTTATGILLRATQAAGAHRFIVQSITGWPNVRDGVSCQGIGRDRGCDGVWQ